MYQERALFLHARYAWMWRGCGLSHTRRFVQNQQKYSIIIASVVTWAERVLVCGIQIHAIQYMRTLVGIINLMLKDGTRFGYRFQLYRLTFHNGKEGLKVALCSYYTNLPPPPAGRPPLRSHTYFSGGGGEGQ